jgi:hypothetical protein
MFMTYHIGNHMYFKENNYVFLKYFVKGRYSIFIAGFCNFCEFEQQQKFKTEHNRIIHDTVTIP